MSFDVREMLAFDREHLWHPYTSISEPLPVYPVRSAAGVRLTLADGRELIDGMASWWSVIHGYNHPILTETIKNQASTLSHVMFGGLTHEPAVALSKHLVDITPEGLNRVFLADSGSVAVEVAMKMALQYHHARGIAGKQKFLTIRSGYHGDTFHCMSVCDPVTGMHHIFDGVLPKYYFADRPKTRFSDQWDEKDTISLEKLAAQHHKELCAIILEPIVQGAGGMRFYHREYLRQVRKVCDNYDLLLIADEIATGFGRTGEMFACNHAAIVPDIMCLGKALTAGYMTLAAVMATREVGEVISSGDPGVFMHGPTFMGNPLACSVAVASIELLVNKDWQADIRSLERGMEEGLAPCRTLDGVAEVRVLGGIGVVELDKPVRMAEIQEAFVKRGVWVRPFGKLVYLMPPYTMTTADLKVLTEAVVEVVTEEVQSA